MINTFVRNLGRIAFVAICFSVTSCSDISSEEYTDRALSSLADNDQNAAIINLKNAIQADSKAMEPRKLLADIYLQRGDFSSAEKEFNRAIRNGAERDIIEPLLARALLRMNDLEALTQLVDNSRTNSPEVMTELLSIKSLSLLQNGKVDEAEYTLELATESGIDTLYSSLSQASIEAENEQLDSAISIVTDMASLHPENSDVWLLLGHLNTAANQHVTAVESYKKAVELSPDAVHYTLFLAQAMVRAEKYQEADKYVSYLLQLSSSHVLANELKAAIQYNLKNFDEAKKHAELAINNGSQNLSVYLIAGVTSYSNGQIEQANNYFTKVVPFVPNDHFVKRMYVSTQFKLGQIDGALKTLEGFDLSSEVNSDFISAMSVEFAKIGRNSDALELAEKASSLSSNSNDLRLGLVKLANNDTSGIDNLQQILSVDPALPEANLGLAYYHLKQGNNEAAEQVVDDWLEATPEDINAILIKGLITLKQKDYDNAKLLFSQVLSTDPGNVSAAIALAQIEAAEGDTQSAFDKTLSLAEQTPDNFVIAKHLFKYAAELDQVDQALKFYQTKTDQSPENVNMKLVLARAYGATGGMDKAISIINGLTPSQQSAQSWGLLVLFHQNQKSYRKALQASEKWLEVDRLNPQAYIKTIQLSELTKNYSKGIKVADEAQALFSDQPGFNLMKAGLLIHDNRLASSQKILNDQPDEIKKTPYFLRLQAKIYQNNKQYSKVVEVQESRYRAQQNLQTAKDLADAYVANNQADKAASFLKSVIEQYGEAAQPLSLMLAQLQLDSKPDEAIARYEAIIQREPNNVIALNNVAWLYLEKQNYTQACQSAEKAYELAKTLPEVQDTYGFCLLKSGKTEQSLQPLKMAYENRKTNIEISLHYVESLIENDKHIEAKSILKGIAPSEPHHIELKDKLQQLTQ
ncbi:PEP-CTERM system TPR-repeat protein PrsT [Photobacterium sanctipauli]|uniref:PEP-CTERM system TPR-repeat protein PrsT n=1 Tax=Photobacterium sanctipauli TaxID=1342794 RepID=A0A2T3NY33_9GAMM|nr:XrtA/PEP-CTERM system TPR-repeat protein PrsT [Photobacterium sanctipauli]PSW21197.1 PEP-CTERM system TPR-repeat protein PrsT [Photobacterium sanctipauli]